MRLKDLAARYAGQDRMVLLVTEVTRMTGGVVCVATVDVTTGAIVRPLQSNGHNWDEALYGDGVLRPGAVVRGVKRQDQGAPSEMPHRTEDCRLVDPPETVEVLGPEDLLEVLLPIVDPDVQAVFDGHLEPDRWLLEGTPCRSLGSVAVRASEVNVYESFGKLKADFRDRTGVSFTKFPITAMDLQGVSAEEVAGLLKSRDDEAVILRIGLARGWAKYDPPRCYAQLNGIVPWGPQ